MRESQNMFDLFVEDEVKPKSKVVLPPSYIKPPAVINKDAQKKSKPRPKSNGIENEKLKFSNQGFDDAAKKVNISQIRMPLE